ncbi:MAG: hypothetical protein AVDCRST_MAG02-3793, partial [uncultured Rubrobacteraceae bacterium]
CTPASRSSVMPIRSLRPAPSCRAAPEPSPSSLCLLVG